MNLGANIKNRYVRQRRITADKREIKDSPKLPSANFFYPQAVKRNFERLL